MSIAKSVAIHLACCLTLAGILAPVPSAKVPQTNWFCRIFPCPSSNQA